MITSCKGKFMAFPKRGRNNSKVFELAYACDCPHSEYPITNGIPLDSAELEGYVWNPSGLLRKPKSLQ